MTECGDATQYSATVSQYFTIPELFALKEFMLKYDIRHMPQMAHQKFNKTGLCQQKHSEKWSHHCEVCKSRKHLGEINMISQTIKWQINLN